MLRLIGFYDYTVILTYLSLFSAVIGMVVSTKGWFALSVACLFLSGFCDAFDGIVARTKKNRTDDEKAFGIQLDSLCDVVSFGVFPALLCYHMGTDGILGVGCCFFYCLCAVIRLAFFNVTEEQRQKTTTEKRKTYRGLPVTSIALILPVVYQFRFVLPLTVYEGMLHVMLAVVGFLFILDFSVKKPDFQKLLTGKTAH